jgi:hypothetical protein
MKKFLAGALVAATALPLIGNWIMAKLIAAVEADEIDWEWETFNDEEWTEAEWGEWYGDEAD